MTAPSVRLAEVLAVAVSRSPLIVATRVPGAVLDTPGHVLVAADGNDGPRPRELHAQITVMRHGPERVEDWAPQYGIVGVQEVNDVECSVFGPDVVVPTEGDLKAYLAKRL